MRVPSRTAAETASHGACAELVVLDKVLELVQKIVRRFAGRLADGVAGTSGSARRVVDAAGAFAYALRRLAEHLAEDVHQSAATAALGAAALSALLGEAFLDAAQNVAKAAAARALIGRSGTGSAAAVATAATGQHVAQQVLEALRAAFCSALGGATLRP